MASAFASAVDGGMVVSDAVTTAVNEGLAAMEGQQTQAKADTPRRPDQVPTTVFLRQQGQELRLAICSVFDMFQGLGAGQVLRAGGVWRDFDSCDSEVFQTPCLLLPK